MCAHPRGAARADKNLSGTLDFIEFVGGVWALCTSDAATLARFAFAFYDVHGEGELQVRGGAPRTDDA